MKSKVVIIGLDGIPFELLDQFSDQGIMPNFKKLRGDAIFTRMRSSIPPISSISWSSIITGKNPAEHGIFGFMELAADTYTLQFPDFNSLKAKPFWQNHPDKKSIILNVPSTYPVKPLNGIHISGFISLNLDKAVYPQNLLTQLEEINYRVDVDSSLAHQSTSLFLTKLDQVLDTRIKLYQHLWKQDWDLFMLVFTGTDRLGHFLWQAYQDEDHQHHQSFLNHFKKIDGVIGKISGQLREKDHLLMLSDHGMGPMTANVYVNRVLEASGFLNLDRSLRSYNQITNKTKAFALDPGRIYLHSMEKYSRGMVSKQDEKNIIKDLIKLFSSLEYQGQKVIKKVYQKKEIYHGKLIDKAPDLVLLANPGFRLRGALNKDTIFDQDIFTGIHTLEDSFLLVRSNSINQVPADVTVEDFSPILESVL